MRWLLGILILAILGLLLRRILWRRQEPLRHMRGLSPLGAEREALYQPIAREVEVQAAILGISLNEAIEERDAGNAEIAWRLVRLSVSEWDRLAEILTVLCTTLSKHLADVGAITPSRSMGAHHFKSPVMVDFVRMHELLDQLVFRSKLRFQLHLRVLRRAVETLSTEFRHTYRYGERSGDRPPQLWRRLDLYFHDLDLVAKETLLAYRTFLLCLPHSALAKLSAELQAVMRSKVRHASISASH